MSGAHRYAKTSRSASGRTVGADRRFSSILCDKVVGVIVGALGSISSRTPSPATPQRPGNLIGREAVTVVCGHRSFDACIS